MTTLTEFSLFVTQVFAYAGDDEGSGEWALMFLLSGVVFYSVMFVRYRNTDKRHHHERETNSVTVNVQGDERLVKRLKNLRNSTMRGSNETAVRGARVGVDKNMIDRMATRVQQLTDD